MKINGIFATDEYLSFLDNYHSIIRDMTLLNKKLFDFENSVDSKIHKRVISKFRRQLIRLKKQYAKADMILCEIDNEK